MNLGSVFADLGELGGFQRPPVTDQHRRAKYSAWAALCFPGKGIDDAPGKLVPALQNFLSMAIFSGGDACHGTVEDCACCVG